MKKKKVLVAALNWGLGHAARCIPVIRAFEKHGCEVAMASDGASLFLLKKEFPHLKAIGLPSYAIRYGNKLPMLLSIGVQLPKILRTIILETRFLQVVQETEHFDVIVSDSRFGCRVPSIANVYLTHQVIIRLPGWLKMFEGLGAALHKTAWEKFDYVWVIDRKGDSGLSGKMGQSYTHPKITHIGILSRFASGEPAAKTLDVCFLLSGPEPQRTILEKAVIDRPWPEDKKYHLIRGLPESNGGLTLPSDWKVSNHLSTEELRTVLLSAKHIVCRSGYSTVMDLARLGVRATLIPTPGQPEQEYLAAYLSRNFHFRNIRQRAFAKNGITMDEMEPRPPYYEKDDDECLTKAIKAAIEKSY